MSQVATFRMPDAGEGLTEAEIVSWRVGPGDRVEVNDVIVEIETAKSLVELPSPFEGVVEELLAQPGSTVEVGEPIISVRVGEQETAAGGGDAGQGDAGQGDAGQGDAGQDDAEQELVEPLVEHARAAAPRQAVADALPAPEPEPEPARQSVLVGYGPRVSSPARRRHLGAAPAPTESPTSPAGAAGAGARAKPAVRALAKELGVDLSAVAGSGAQGLVTADDVRSAAESQSSGQSSGQSASEVAARPAAGTRVPVRGVRRATARAMVASAFTAPHVSEWVQVDVTRSVKLLARLRQDPVLAALRPGPLLLFARAVLQAAVRHPGVNASWDEPAGEIVLHPAVNLGFAVAAPRGLLVPNIPAADRLPVAELARQLSELVTQAREGRTQPGRMSGGTLTITNVGVFGVDGGTPILNPGEAMIVAMGQIRDLPWVHRGRVVPRKVMTISVSFDHRLVDGELGSRFLAEVAATMHDPGRSLLVS